MPSATIISEVTRGAGEGPLKHRRLVALDAARVFAMFAIVWIHTPRSAALIPTIAVARFAVPFFVAASVLLTLRSFAKNPDRPYGSFAWVRIHRLGLPFVAWTLIYLAFKGLKRIIAPHQPNDFPGWEVIMVGSAYHLWFLPFLLAVSLFVGRVAPSVVQCNRPGWWIAGAGVTAIVMAIAPVPALGAPWEALGFMWLATPAVFAAIALYFLLQKPVTEWPWSCHPASLLCGLIASTIYVVYFGRNGVAETVAGCTFLLLVLQLPESRWVARLAQFAPLTFGIYLSHLLFIKVVESVATRLQFEPSALLDMGIFTFAVWGSTSLAWILSSRRGTQWIVG